MSARLGRVNAGEFSAPRRVRSGVSMGRRVAILVGCAALVLAGCSTTKSGRSGASGQAAPGITADEVKIGAVFPDLGTLSQQLGLQTDPPGDIDKQIQIMTEWVNKNGGMGGRKMVPDLKKFNASTDSPSVEESLCNGFTQDDKVFAAVLTGQFQDNARPCYQRKRTIAVDATYYPLDEATYEAASPYLWAPGLVAYDTYVKPFVSALSEQKFFEGSQKVGIIAPDTAINKKMVESLAIPAMTAAGVSSPLTQYIDVKSTESLNSGLFQTATKYKDAGVDRVVFFGGQRLAPFFATSTIALDYFPQYGLTSYDNPKSILDNQKLAGGNPIKAGAAGLSFMPVSDVTDAQLPFPDGFNESQCQSIYAQGGLNLKTRTESSSPFYYCDAVLFIKAALDKAKVDGAPDALSPEDFGKAAKSLGEVFQASRNLGTGFAGNHAGADNYRLLAYDATCTCFQLKGENEPFKAG